VKKRLLLKIQYDGGLFSGYEKQIEKRTVRGVLEETLSSIFGEKISIDAVSRTDAGVHSLCQGVSFHVDTPIPVANLKKVINSKLPSDIAVSYLTELKKNKGIRELVLHKEYEYLVFNGEVLPPIFSRYLFHVKRKLDFLSMKKAIKFIVGRHDFSSFCAANSSVAKSGSKNFTRTILKASISKKKIGLWSGSQIEVISFKITGDGFLYKMVRNIVGTLIEIGHGARKPEDMNKILKGKMRSLGGKTAPPNGLALIDVKFDNISF